VLLGIIAQAELFSADEPGRKTFHHSHAEIYQFHPVKSHLFFKETTEERLHRLCINRWPEYED